MSLGCLAELVSVTNEALKSVNKSSIVSQSTVGTSDKIHFFSAGSPFDSPRSFTFVSDKSENSFERGKENVNFPHRPTSCELTTLTSEKNIANNATLTGREEEVAMIIEIMPCKIVQTSSTENQHSDHYDENTSNNRKVSISKKLVREIISPREKTSDQNSCSSHDNISSKGSNNSKKKRQNYVSTTSSLKGKCFVERHEPNTYYENMNNNRILGDENEEDSADVSKSSDQPEIIDVHGRVVAITSGMSQSSDDSVENIHNQAEEVVAPGRSKNGVYDHISSGKNEQGHSLKQGSLSKGSVDRTKTSIFNDVYISQFGLTEKQRGLKEALAKRSENNKPKKKFVQPQIIQKKIRSDDEIDSAATHSQSDSARAVTTSADPMVTAAAAASAAVAAAQPFLKTQLELETKMQQLLGQLAELQQKASVTGVEEKSAGSENRILDLERQVAEINERRFEHLENLQQQQLQMQAQLLFMSQSRDHSSHGYLTDRQMSSSRQRQMSRIPQVVGKHSDIPSQNTDFNPVTRSQPVYNPSAHSQSIYNPSIHIKSMYNPSTHNKPILNPAVLSKHHNYLNEVRELQGSHLDTPAPRNRVPKPTPYTLPQEPQKNLGFLEELLAHKENIDQDTTYSVKGDYSSPTRLESDRSNNARGSRRDQSPVDKARKLITSLSNLEKETAESLWGSRDGLNKSYKKDIDLGPAPLDRYLKYPEKEGSPYPKLSHHSKEKKKMLDNMDNYLEAKNMLRHLEVTRETLENNIDQVVRCRRDMYVYSTLLGSGSNNGATDDQLRIEKLVNNKISSLEGDVQREVSKSLAQAETDKLVAQQKLELAAKQKFDQARSGTLKGQAERSARLAYNKPNMLAMAASSSRNKESTVRPPPKTTTIKDEATRVRTYGKPEYQRGRTTIRDPYLHFKNPKKGIAAKSSVTNLNESARSREGRSRSPPRTQGQEPVIDFMPRQFYFSPTRGYIPLGAGDTVPIQGQLVSIAIPLGAPRLEPGVRWSAVPVTKSSSAPVSSTPVTAARNVAMVSFPVGDGQEHERQPELTKQVLPPIDIDSISSVSSGNSDIHIRSPQQDNANVTFLYNTRDDEDIDLNKTLTEESFDLEQSGEGIKLPGYEPKTAKYSGPSFPPQVKKSDHWTVNGGEVRSAQQVSDVMAEDLRRRDLLENNTVMWLEQELMARILSQAPLQIPEQSADVSKEESEGSGFDESLLVADVIGQGGMQLFIDAGQPVNNALVQQLVVEVIKEKVMAMMAQRETQGQSQPGQARVRNEVEEALEEMEREKIVSGSYRVPTPEPTPKTSPVPSPKHVKQHAPQPVTPPQSPPAEGFRFKQREPESQEQLEPVRQPQVAAESPLILTNVESESETSVSLDISEELKRVAAKGKPEELNEQIEICHDVATPPLSPPPASDEEKQLGFQEKQITPTSTPPMIKTPPRMRTPSPKRQESVSDDEVEEKEMEQPQPIMMSVGVGDDRPMTAETQTQHRSPSPKRPHTPVSTMSEASTTSTESSATETVNEIISEGQWLMSYSEGQVVGAVNYEAIRKIMGKDYHQAIDVSTASTLRDTDDLDLDVEGTKSEGEVLYRFSDPEKDPRLEVLAQMQKRMPHVQQILSGPVPTVGMSSTSRSVGELSIGQVPPSRVAMEQPRRRGEHGQRVRERPARSPSPRVEGSMEDDYNKDRQNRSHGDEQQHSRTSSPQHHSRTSSPQHHNRTQSPEQQHSRTTSPQQNYHDRIQSRQQQLRSRTPPHQDIIAISSQHEQRSRTPPQQDQLSRTQSPRQKETMGARTRGQMQYQPVLSDGRPIATRGRNMPGQRGSRRSSDSRLSQNSDPGMRRSDSSYHSESLSRSADGDILRRTANGFLTSSLKSGQSVVKKSVEFDLSGTLKSSRRGSRDLSDHMGDPNNSAGLTYTEDSLDESELRRIDGGVAKSLNVDLYRMSVTIPSAAEGEESELSEIDLSSRSDK